MRWAPRILIALLAVVLAGAAVAPGASAARKTRHGARSNTGRVTVLGYHAIADHSADPVVAEFSVPPSLFAEQLDYLRRRGWKFVDLDAVLAALRGERKLPRRALLLTFDDAYTDLLEAACPMLEERGIPAVGFAVSGETGGCNAWDQVNGASRLALLDADGLREIAARGIEVGSHTASHATVTEISEEQLDAELGGSAETLEALGLPRPRAFSYPYGVWDERVAAAVEDAGYEIAFAVERGVVDGKGNRYALPRLAVHADDSPKKLHLKLLAAGWPEWLRGALRRLARRPQPAGTDAAQLGEAGEAAAPGAAQSERRRQPSGYTP